MIVRDTAPKRFEELSEDVKALLGRLDANDVDLLEKSIDLSRKIASTAKIIRWVIITIAAFVIAFAGLGDAIVKIVRLFTGAQH